MTPTTSRDRLGWDAPARGMLITVALVLGLAMAWISSESRAGNLAWNSLSVDANSAPIPVLGALPGLGPVLAGRIVEGRPYGSLEDLDRRVKGIGPAKSAALRSFLRFDSDSVGRSSP